MSVADQAWVQQSLQQLEQLESRREHAAQSGASPAQLGELDEEIAALYQVLERVAEQADGDAPVAAAPQATAAPFAAVAPAEAPISIPDDSFDRPPRSPMVWMAPAALLIGALGVGGWFMAGQQQVEAAPAAPTGPAKVLSATDIPPDTQGPVGAKGGDAAKTPGTLIPTPQRTDRPRRSSGKKTRRASSKPKGRAISFGDRKDPLAGAG